MEELGPLEKIWRLGMKAGEVITARATRCKVCGHFHRSGAGCGHITYPYASAPCLCHCTDLDTWRFEAEEAKP